MRKQTKKKCRGSAPCIPASFFEKKLDQKTFILHQPSGLSNSAFAKQNATHDLRVARIGLKVKPTPEILFPPTFLGIQLDFCEAKWRHSPYSDKLRASSPDFCEAKWRPYFLAAKSWMGYKIHGILYLPRFHNQPHGGTLLAVDFNFRESRRTD